MGSKDSDGDTTVGLPLPERSQPRMNRQRCRYCGSVQKARAGTCRRCDGLIPEWLEAVGYSMGPAHFGGAHVLEADRGAWNIYRLHAITRGKAIVRSVSLGRFPYGEQGWMEAYRAFLELEPTYPRRRRWERWKPRIGVTAFWAVAIGMGLAAILADGWVTAVISFALLFSDGTTGWVEDVATLEPYRRQGLSRAVVTKALEESRARHDFTFLIADDRDWPKHFYSQLGFDILGRHYYFLKQPPETA